MEYKGTYYGVDVKSGKPIYYNRSEEGSGHEFIFGMPGGGKSHLAKAELKEVFLNSDDDIIVIQEEGESVLNYIPKLDRGYLSYSSFAELYGQTHIRVPSYNRNPFKIAYDKHSENSINNSIISKSLFLLALISEISEIEELSAKQKYLIDNSIRKMYYKYIESDNDMVNAPSFLALLTLLKKEDDSELENIIKKIEEYLDIINISQLDIEPLKSRLTVYSMFGVCDRIYNVKLLLLLDSIEEKILQNNIQGKKTHIVIDFCDRFFAGSKLTSAILRNIVIRFRTYGARITLVSSNIDEILKNDIGKNIVTHMSTIRILGQPIKNRDIIKEYFGLSDGMLRYICNCPVRGEGILLYARGIIPFIYE